MVSENKNDTETTTKGQEQEDEFDIDGTRKEIVAKAEGDVQEAHIVNDEIKSQDPDSQESDASQKLVNKADKDLEDFKTQVENETNNFELSNDDLKFFMDTLEKKDLGDSDVFLFVQNELKEREKNDIDHDSIEFSKKQNKEDKKDIEEDDQRYRVIFQEINKETSSNSSDSETKEDFMRQFKDGEGVYNFLKENSGIRELWRSTTEEDRGRLVDMMVDFAIENNLPKDEIKSLSQTIEVSRHIGKVKSYKWLYGLEPIVITGDGPDSKIMTEVDETGAELGKEYEFEDEEFEKLKLFLGPKGGGKWDSAIVTLFEDIEGDLELSSTDIGGYDVEKLSENSIALLLILEDKKIKLTMNFDHENKSINIGAKETITDLPESEIETEEVVQELDPELVRQFEEDVVTSQQEIEEEREERREKWEDEDDKESAIEEEKNTIEERLEKRLIKENQDILETEMSADGAENQDLSGQRNVQEILKSYEKIKDLRNSLEAEVNQEMTKREEISNSIQASLTPENADLSQLNNIERDMLKKSTNDILKTTKNVLSMKEIDYLMETMGSESNFGDLKGTHENRKIEMEKLQDTIDALDKFRELVEEFEILSERTLTEQREEVTQTVEGLEHIQKSNKKLFAALVALGVVAGVVALCCATGTPLPAFLTAKNIIIAGSAVAAAGTLAYLYKKDKLPSLKQSKEAAKFATGLSLAGGFLAVDSLFNGKEVDNAFKFLCGTDLPSWAQSSVKK